MRYHKPSWKNLLGISRAKNRIKKATGLTAIDRRLNWPKYAKWRMKRKMGYYSEPAKFLRFLYRIIKKRS